MKTYLTKFEMSATFENGQCFRWNKKGDYYIGVAFGEVVRLREVGDKMEIVTSGDHDVAFWQRYFFLDDTSNGIDKCIASIDENVKKAVRFGAGMKILRQDPFETVLSFITSSNNNLKRIKLIVERLSERYGKKISFDGDIYYAFPRPIDLQNVRVEEYREIGFGYRDKYIYDAVQKVVTNELDLDSIYHFDRDNALAELMKVNGVGKKVASCIALFAYSKYDAFPVDVWINRVLTKMYREEVSKYSSLDEFVDKYFGAYSGIAQQYLFYYARENNI